MRGGRRAIVLIVLVGAIALLGMAALFALGGGGVPTDATVATSDGVAPVTTAAPTTLPETIPPPSTTTVTGADAQRLEECEADAQRGEVSFAPSQQMTVGKTSQFRVTASVGGAQPGGTTSQGAGSTFVAQIALRCEVQAQLRGADFEIDPEASQPGSFLDRPSVVWSWDVVPLHAGTSILTLEIKSIAVINGRRIEGAGGQLYTSTITIDAKHETWWDKSKRWSGDVTGHPLVQGFGSLLLVGGAVAAGWRWLFRRPWPWTRSSGAGAPAQSRATTDSDAPKDEVADDDAAP